MTAVLPCLPMSTELHDERGERWSIVWIHRDTGRVKVRHEMTGGECEISPHTARAMAERATIADWCPLPEPRCESAR